MKIEKYEITRKQEWNSFVAGSKNATFLFFRNYMDYHSERYEENSLMVYNSNELLALFPANIVEGSLVSHGFLTYGGFLVDSKMKTHYMLRIFEEVKKYCRQIGVSRIIYKTIPYIYCREPSEEDLYSLFRNDARLLKCEVSSCIYLPGYAAPLNRRNGYNKAIKNNLIFSKTDDYETFLAIVNCTLKEKYGKTAAHSSDELQMLQHRFPENIKLYAAYKGDSMLGGAVIFENNRTAHAQYLHSSDEGKKYRCLDFILITLLKEVYANFTYFDFGHSTEDGGLYLNESLINLKEEFCGRAVCYNTYSLEF